MTEQEVIAIREKYKNPKVMQEAVFNVANIFASEFIKGGAGIGVFTEKTYTTKKYKPKGDKIMAGQSKVTELENVLLDQIEKLNDDSIMEEPEKAKILIDRSRAISDLSKNLVDLQQLKLNVVKTVERNGGAYNKYLGIEQ